MNHRRILRSTAALLGAVGLFLSVGQASAHVGYGTSLYTPTSVIDPVTGLAGTGSVFSNQNSTASSNAGWIAGQDTTTWANSHDNRFRYFYLDSEATIDFTITGTDLPNGTANGGVSAGVLNPGYSIFQGVVPSGSHDGSGNLPDGQFVPLSYVGAQTGFATWSPFAATNDEIDANNGAAGLTTAHWGTYRSNGDVTMANNGVSLAAPGVASTMLYTGLFGSNGTGNTVTGHYQLGPGLYSLVIGGANSADLAALLSAAQATNGHYNTAVDPVTGLPVDPLTNPAAVATYNQLRLGRTFNVAFNVTPVPLPAAVWLFGSGVVGVIALARRRMSV